MTASRRSKTRRIGIVVCCLIAATVALVWLIRSRPHCGCTTTTAAAAAIRTLAGMQWQGLDQRAVAAAWPDAAGLPCEPPAGAGLEAIVAGIERCCSTCGTCGGPFLEGGEAAANGLRAIGVTICRRSPEETLAELKTLVEAAVPPDPAATFESGGWRPSPGVESVQHSYRWQGDGETFILDADAYGDGGRWVGRFDLARCSTMPAVETWTLEDGLAVPVLRSETDEDPTQGRRRLRLAYLSSCLLRDSTCLDAEAKRLWPRVQALAERQGASVVFLSAEDCKLGGRTVFPSRKPTGEWDLPWSGCETGGE